MALQPFHLAIPVHDLALARHFYGTVFGCSEGRSSDHWVDFDFFGHQLVIHYQAPAPAHPAATSGVGDHDVPVPHFGVVLSWEGWETLAARLREQGVRFEIEPCIRFAGQVGEQGTMFLYDPCGNALEFKCFKDIDQLFAR
ncbi:VOC family protein [Alloalcanivorax sp. C16-2]|uniref:VOC family protein n=1 Tax=Alloalcanivorax TaxID=3020832 RepID=UPI00193294F4|nr:VOC family protein [Alloalcanivorax marinus]MBL7250115.1 VOC family protein [Alloalcanivorax marinus]